MSHWYIYKNNIPQRYFQYRKDGEISKVVRRGQAMKDGAVESVTTILSYLGETGGLLHWSASHAIEAALAVAESGMPTHEDHAAVVKEAKAEWKRRTEEAANRGTEIHDAIETAISSSEVSADDPILRRAQQEAVAWLSEHEFTNQIMPEHCLIYHGVIPTSFGPIMAAYGGTTDVISCDGIVDWKTIEDTGRGYRKPKATEAAQASAYRWAAWNMDLCDRNIPAWDVYFDRATGAIVREIKWTKHQLNHGLNLLALAVKAKAEEELIERAKNINSL